MIFGFEFANGFWIFLAGLIGAIVVLFFFLRWRHATALARARRIAQQLRQPADSLAAVEDRSAAVEELLEFPDSRAAANAARELLGEKDVSIRSAAIEVLRQTRALDLWVRQLRRGSYRTKLRAIEALGEVGDERAIDELLEALADDDPDIARAASRAISYRDLDYACERLADALSSPNSRLAETAAAGLVHLGDEAVEPLVGQLTNINQQARRLAAESLGNIGGSHLKDALLPLLTNDPAPSVRVMAASALARVDGEEAINEIQHLARSDPDWFVRARAYALLAEMNAPHATTFLLEGISFEDAGILSLSNEEHEIDAVSEGPQRVRRSIIAGLRLLGFSEEQLASVNRTTSLPPEQVNEALEALEMLRNPDAGRRAEGARQLSEIGKLATEALIASLGDPDPMVRAEVARAIGRIGSRDALFALARCLQDPDAGVRLATASAVRAVVTREAAKELTD